METRTDNEPERWKPIPGYEGEYECSSYGRMRSLTKSVNGHNGPKIRKGKILKQALRGDYLFVKLSSKGIAKAVSVHVMTAILFVENPDNKPTVNHDDGVKTNNSYWNLSWATRSEQIKHAVKLGLFNPVTPTKKGDKLSEATKAKMSVARTGKKFSTETRNKISEGLKKWHTSNQPQKAS